MYHMETFWATRHWCTLRVLIYILIIYSHLECKVQDEEDYTDDEGGQGCILDVNRLCIIIVGAKVPVCSLHNPSMENGNMNS